MIDNYFIADQFSLLAKLMDVHGENSFKSKSYSSSAFTIEKLPEQLSTLQPAEFSKMKGIGDSAAKKISEILETGKLLALEELIGKTPSGILEMLTIKGLGPKKISTIWKEMEIETIGELLYACNENRLMMYKGFGQKTQENVRDTIEFYLRNQGSHLYAETEPYVLAIDKKIKAQFPNHKFQLTGEFSRQLEIINQVEWVTTTSIGELKTFFEQNKYLTHVEEVTGIQFSGEDNVRTFFHITDEKSFAAKCIGTGSSAEFLAACQQKPGWTNAIVAQNEEEFFEKLGISYCPPFLREQSWAVESNSKNEIIQPTDIRGIIHSHSKWSDGSNTIEEMAAACIAKGLEYLVISDHSKSAFYANGLSEERIREQHQLIDELNTKLAPFRIFKSIESDILNDGSLDYPEETLKTFDLVIASVHSNLKMTEEKAMSRLLKAIENPYTTILGHMTGRLLLSRKGYPVDHSRIIDACKANNVVIELNAHPRRLDMGWQYIHEAIEKGVLISIDPDAHTIDGFDDCRFGVLSAQKAGVTAKDNLSSFTLQQFEAHIGHR
ncbi:MAG: DNA polymerase/3'-5' exonuclease PolX [Gemmatimonadaceae bacterium]|nr:DNA polymerase/3'-5' exonuclease PolX [Chitinophagaceae bacterium]